MIANLLKLIIPFVFFKPVIGNTTKEPIKDAQMMSTLKSASIVPTADTWEGTANINSFWISNPSRFIQPPKEEESPAYKVSLRAPFGLTRLTKPLTYGIDPYFNKEYFEPYDKRQKPVTLVALRRNGVLPKHSVKIENSESAEIAEMQSPFNEISNFWQEEPLMFNE